MSDLASLFQNNPMGAAFMVGQNNRVARDSERLRQQELQQLIAAKLQEMEQKKLENPLELERKRLMNEGLAAELPGKREDVRTKQFGNAFTEATQPSAIQATIAGNEGNVDEVGYKKADRFQNWLMETGAALEGTEAPLRMSTLVKQMEAANINPSSKMAQNMVQELRDRDPSTWPGFFQKMADNIGKVKSVQSPEYRASTENSVRSAASAKYTADSHASSAREVANINARSREEVARMKTVKDEKNLATIASKLGFEKAATFATFKAMEAETQEEKDKWLAKANEFQEAQLRAKRAGALGRPDPSGMGVPTVPAEEPNLGKPVLAPAGAAQVGPPGSATNPIKLK